jgi:hypothetical protein
MFSTTARASALAAALLLLAASHGNAQSKTLVGNVVTSTVTIVAVEQSSRTLTVRTEKGTYETIQAPPEVKRFSELKVGDKITARYYENVVVRLKKPDEPAVDVEEAAAVRGTGASPAAAGAVQRTMTVTITAKDPATSAVTVNGPNGYAYSRKVADKKTFDSLKVGDRLDMTWTDALLLAVEPAGK